MLDEIYEEIETGLESLGEEFSEGFSFLNQLQSLPEENQLIIFSEICYDIDTNNLAQKYSKRFEQSLDKTIFALSFIKIKLISYREQLQVYYTPILDDSLPQLVWFDPEVNVDDVLRQCLSPSDVGDPLHDLESIKRFQMARAVTLFKKQSSGDVLIRNKDIDTALEIARKASTTIADIQVKTNIFETAGSQINVKVQTVFNNLADALPEEQKNILPDVVGKFLAWADSRKEAIDVEAEEVTKVKRGRGRPRKLPREEDYK